MEFPLIYLVFILGIPLLLSLYAQWKVKSAFNTWKEEPVSSNMTGAEAARRMLDAAGLGQVTIEQTEGTLSDHYDHREKTLALSNDVYNGRTVSAVGVACHEAGHAIQDARDYRPLTLRNYAVPTARFGSSAGVYLALGGLLLNMSGLVLIGAIAFGGVVLFQLINLPVEFDASARAKEELANLGIIQSGREEEGVNEVLNSAALTYVAATLVAISQMLYFLFLAFAGE